MRSRLTRVAVLFGFIAAVVAGVVPAVDQQSAPAAVSMNCPWWGCVIN
jgi:hypothetical protein